MAWDGTASRGMEGDGADAMLLVDWWLGPGAPLYHHVLPDRIYWYLGANVSYSQGENEWYSLLSLLRLQAPHWTQERGPRGNSDVGSGSTAGSSTLRVSSPAPPDSDGSASSAGSLVGGSG